MKISYKWLNSFFNDSLPPVEEVVHALTFHAWEVEDVEHAGEDTVFEVKVLPDRTHHALSHRGVAKDLSVILGTQLVRDPLKSNFAERNYAPHLEVHIESSNCDRYQAAVIEGVNVGPSPEWLVQRLTALGQRSINNIVDATNYVMFELGQPLHAFDMHKLADTNGVRKISVRTAHEGEVITTLTGETYSLTTHELLIVDGTNDTPIGIAGIKGGKQAEIDTSTNSIVIESAHFNPITTRKSSQRLKLRTDASTRFENGVIALTTEPALKEVVELILTVAGGTFVGLSETRFLAPEPTQVSVSIEKIQRVLGVPITDTTIRDIIDRFGYPYAIANGVLTIVPPIEERSDLLIPEDVIEELGRIYGYDHVPSVTPSRHTKWEVNKRFYYSEKVRDVLVSLGFSEIYTSSFRAKDEVKLKNALATDKGYLRSSLRENLHEALMRNVPNRDLLALSSISLFEIGTIFSHTKEIYSLAIGVRHGMEYKEKSDKSRLVSACDAIASALGTTLVWDMKDGIAEVDLGSVIEGLSQPEAYTTPYPNTMVTYVSYPHYPAMSRDVAFWTTGEHTTEALASLIQKEAGPLLVRLTLFDEFSKDGRTSYAFRLVFQSGERTLTDEEVTPLMERVTKALKDSGFDVR